MSGVSGGEKHKSVFLRAKCRGGVEGTSERRKCTPHASVNCGEIIHTSAQTHFKYQAYVAQSWLDYIQEQALVKTKLKPLSFLHKPGEAVSKAHKDTTVQIQVK